LIDKPLTHLKGVGEKKAKIISNELEIDTLMELLFFRPRRYLDRSTFKKIKDCNDREEVTISGEIISNKIIFLKKNALEIIVDDSTDYLYLIFWGGIKFFQKKFTVGEKVILSGKISIFRGKRQMSHPDFYFTDDIKKTKSIDTGRIVPIYKSTEKLKSAYIDSRFLRRLIYKAIDLTRGQITEDIPNEIISKNNFYPLEFAIKKLHFPENFSEIKKSIQRLAFNEAYLFILNSRLYKKSLKTNKIIPPKIKKHENIYKNFRDEIPFELTPDQKKSIKTLTNEIQKHEPMNRLLQGDVGSGKTIVAFAAAIFAMELGYQVAFMSPTSILTEQHFNNFSQFKISKEIDFEILTSDTKESRKKEIQNSLTMGSINLIFGTHSLIQDRVNFKNLGLIIIDEQHRFGVDQRKKLRGKNSNAHLLLMSATPIPRTLTQTFFSDMDVSLIKSMPANKQKIKTMIFPESRIKGIYNSMKKYITKRQQIYYVLPLIEESEMTDLTSAKETFTKLKKTFTGNKIALLHGKLKNEEKNKIMNNFLLGKIDILVSTTVIEVGIDVKNATVMIIENPERFGLAQLHQLRGRVGRGSLESFCILIYKKNISEEALDRIKNFTKISDGFELAELDLQKRGSGEISGLRQHGYRGNFKFLNIMQDREIIDLAIKSVDNSLEKI